MGKKDTLAPGFRFYPTDLELVFYYLKRKILGKKFSFKAPIAEVDIYKYAPWDLPDMSCLKTGDLKWYFFCPIEKKYGKGGRLNRATIHGYWKITGKDKPVEHNGKVVGTRKTLVFHRGKAPRGERTDWVMHEYKLEENILADCGNVQDNYMLSVVFEKDGLGPRNGSQYGAPFKEEDWSDDEEETIVPGAGSLCGMPTVAVGGASSSIFPGSLCVAPSVESVDHSNDSIVAVGGAGSSLIPDGLCVSPSVDSLCHTNAPTMAVVGASSSLFLDSVCVGPSAQSVGLANACAASTFVEAPEVPVVADATIPTLLEAGGDQESNINILSLLDTFTEEEPSQSYLPCMEDDTVAAMLESFTEVDDPNNYSFIF